MKFKDKDKDGIVFDDIVKAHAHFCRGEWCSDCVMNKGWYYQKCVDYAKIHPIEAARLMGYEVVEDTANDKQMTNKLKEDNMDKQKPRICEVLGVEVGELVTYKADDTGEVGLEVLSAGNIRFTFYKGKGFGPIGQLLVLTNAINHPERIIHSSRFTKEEVADAKVLARALSADGFEREMTGAIYATSSKACWHHLDGEMFPSILPGQSVTLAEIVGNDTDG